MLKRQNRLSSNFQFNVSRKYGSYYESALCHLYTLKPQKYNGEPKFGIVVSNKFHKKAVKRNRVKRLYREVLAANLSKFGKNLWIVVHPKFSTLGKSYEEISTDFNKILQKIPLTD